MLRINFCHECEVLGKIQIVLRLLIVIEGDIDD